MGGRMSRQKGQRGEREFAKILEGHGISAHRGRQYSGHPDAPDVKHEYDGSIHFEVKRTERLCPWPFMRQAEEDAGDRMPVVAWRKNGEGWLVFMRAEDYIPLMKAAMGGDGDEV